MSILLPPALAWVAYLAVGEEWPKGDEDKLRELSEAWEEAAGELLAISREVGPSVAGVLESMAGPVAGQFREFVGTFLRNLPQTARSAEQLARLARTTAVELRYAKYMILVQLAWMAFEIAQFAVYAPQVVPAIVAAGRAAVRMILRRLAISIVAGVGLMVGMDVAVQTFQMMMGDRTRWNAQNTLSMLKAGAIGGAIGGALPMVAGKVVPKYADTLVGKLATGGVTGLVTTLAQDVLLGGSSGLAGAFTSGMTEALSGGGRRFRWQKPAGVDVNSLDVKLPDLPDLDLSQLETTPLLDQPGGGGPATASEGPPGTPSAASGTASAAPGTPPVAPGTAPAASGTAPVASGNSGQRHASAPTPPARTGSSADAPDSASSPGTRGPAPGQASREQAPREQTPAGVRPVLVPVSEGAGAPTTGTQTGTDTTGTRTAPVGTTGTGATAGDQPVRDAAQDTEAGAQPVRDAAQGAGVPADVVVPSGERAGAGEAGPDSLREVAAWSGLDEAGARALWAEAARITWQYNPFSLTVSEQASSLRQRDPEQFWHILRVARELHTHGGPGLGRAQGVEAALDLARRRGPQGGHGPQGPRGVLVGGAGPFGSGAGPSTRPGSASGSAPTSTSTPGSGSAPASGSGSGPVSEVTVGGRPRTASQVFPTDPGPPAHRLRTGTGLPGTGTPPAQAPVPGHPQPEQAFDALLPDALLPGVPLPGVPLPGVPLPGVPLLGVPELAGYRLWWPDTLSGHPPAAPPSLREADGQLVPDARLHLDPVGGQLVVELPVPDVVGAGARWVFDIVARPLRRLVPLTGDDLGPLHGMLVETVYHPTPAPGGYHRQHHLLGGPRQPGSDLFPQAPPRELPPSLAGRLPGGFTLPDSGGARHFDAAGRLRYQDTFTTPDATAALRQDAREGYLPAGLLLDGSLLGHWPDPSHLLYLPVTDTMGIRALGHLGDGVTPASWELHLVDAFGQPVHGHTPYFDGTYLYFTDPTGQPHLITDNLTALVPTTLVPPAVPGTVTAAQPSALPAPADLRLSREPADPGPGRDREGVGGAVSSVARSEWELWLDSPAPSVNQPGQDPEGLGSPAGSVDFFGWDLAWLDSPQPAQDTSAVTGEAGPSTPARPSTPAAPAMSGPGHERGAAVVLRRLRSRLLQAPGTGINQTNSTFELARRLRVTQPRIWSWISQNPRLDPWRVPLSVLDKISAVEENWRLEPLGSHFVVTVGWREAAAFFRPDGAFQQWATVLPGSGHSLRFERTADLPRLVARDDRPVPGGSVTRDPDGTLRVRVAGQDIWRVGPDRAVHAYQRPADSGPDPAHQLYTWSQAPDGPGAPAGPGREEWKASLAFVQHTYPLLKEDHRLAATLGSSPKQLRALLATESPADPGDRLWGRLRVLHYLAIQKVEGGRIASPSPAATGFDVVFDTGTSLRFTAGGQVVSRRTDLPGSELHLLSRPPGAPPELMTASGSPAPQQWQTVLGDDGGVRVGLRSPDGGDGPVWQVSADGTLESFTRPAGAAEGGLFGRIAGSGVLGGAAGGGYAGHRNAGRGQGTAAEVARRLVDPVRGGTRDPSVPSSVGRAGGRVPSRLAPGGEADTGSSGQVAAGAAAGVGAGVSGQASPAGPDPMDAAPAELPLAGMPAVPVPGGGADPARRLLYWWLENPAGPELEAWRESLALLETKHQAKTLAAKARLLGIEKKGVGPVVRGKYEASVGFKWRVRLAAHLADSEGTGTGSEGTRNWHIETYRYSRDYFSVVFGETTVLEFHGGNLLGWSVLRLDHDMRVRFGYVPPVGWGEPELTTREGDEPVGAWELRVGADRRSVTVSDLSPGGDGRPEWQLGPEQLPPPLAARHVPGGGADLARRLLRWWLEDPDRPVPETWQASLTHLETEHQAKTQQAKARLLGMSTQNLGSVVRGKREVSVGFKWRVRLAAHLADSEGTGTEGTRNWQIKTDWKQGDYFHVVFGETTVLEFHGGNLLGWSVLRPGHDMRVRFGSGSASGWGEPELTTLKGDKEPVGAWELRVGADRRGITVSDLSPGGERTPRWQLSPEQLPQRFTVPPPVPEDHGLFRRRFGTGLKGVFRTGTGVSGQAPPAGPDPRDAIPAGLPPVPVPGGGADLAHRLLRWWLKNPAGPELEAKLGAWRDSLALLGTEHQAKTLAAKARLLGVMRQNLGPIVRGKREASVGFKWRVLLAAHLAGSEGIGEGIGSWHIETDRKRGDYFHVVFGETTVLEFHGGNLLGWSVLRPGGQDMRVRFGYVPTEGWGEPELTTREGDKAPVGVWELRVGADRRGITVSDLSQGGERRPRWQLGPEQLPPSFALPPAVPGDTDLFGRRFGTGVESVSRTGTGPQWRVPPAGTLESLPPPPSGTAGGSAVSGPAGAGVPDLSPGAASTPAGEAAAGNPQPGGLAGTGLPGMDPGLDPFHLSEPPASAEADTAPSYLHTINWADISPL